MHLKRKRKTKKRKIINILTAITILIIICIILIYKYFNGSAKETFINYSEIETKKIINIIVDSTVTEEISNGIEDDILIISKNNNNEINSIDFDMVKVNKILINVSKTIENNLNNLSNGNINNLTFSKNVLKQYDMNKLKKGIFFEIPSGIIFNNLLLSNLLPKIPVRLELINNVFCKIGTSIDSYGINSAIIKVNLDITIDVKILLPITTKTTQAKFSIPILIKLINSSIPDYYFNGLMTNPSIN